MKRSNVLVADAPVVAVGDGPLSGMTMAVKDVFVDQDRAPTCGSLVHAVGLSGTAQVLQRLRRAGAEIVAYANLHEWGVGTSSIVTASGPIANPRDPARIAGGSSGGSAAAVAAGMVDAALGTDAGGSIRIPSACCGVVGLKPTHGAVPTDGFFAHGSGVDHVGPIAPDVATVRRVFEVLTGTTTAALDPAAMRLGVTRDHFVADLDPLVAAGMEATVEVLRGIVREVRDVTVDGAETARRAMPALVLGGVLEHLGDAVDERLGDFQPDTRDALVRARSLDDDDRSRAIAIQTTVTRGFAEAFDQVDVIVTPTISAAPPPIDDPVVRLPSGDRSVDQAYVGLNAPMNLAGVPALSVPCADLGAGLTMSVTLTAAHDRDDAVLALGEALEDALGRRYTTPVSD